MRGTVKDNPRRTDDLLPNKQRKTPFNNNNNNKNNSNSNKKMRKES